MNEILKYFVMSYFYHLDILNLNLINKFEYLDKKKIYEKNVNAKFSKNSNYGKCSMSDQGPN